MGLLDRKELHELLNYPSGRYCFLNPYIRRFLISAEQIQSMIITSARACLLDVLDTSYESSLSLTDSSEK
ncbi:hypothetical protein RCL_jg1272.t1 [Rhizophagus clarus]|uniref:Uncharacterized protein n=1 Tax=Rhizophagus clarus TaxID=94130 RepID=A0A8H3QGM9_9GLOM|nr:hypothetical protein RCL_jg1272.t1 [Rhizophagus clarus]